MAGNVATTPTPDNEPVTPQGFLDWLEDFGKSVGKAFESAGEDIWASVKDLGEIALDEAKVFYYQSGLAELLQNMSEADAEKLQQQYADALSGDFKSYKNDVSDLVSNVVKIIQAPGKLAVGSVLAGIGDILNDPSLAQDYDSMLDEVADAVGTAIGTGMAVTARLSTTQIMLMTSIIVGISVAPATGFGPDWSSLANDIVSSILDSVTISVNGAKDIIADVIKSVGYLIKLITDSIIDTGAAVEAVFDAAIYNENIAQAYLNAQTDLSTHQNFISQLVTVGLMVAVTVGIALLTGGVGIGFAISLGATLAFGGLMAVSGYQQDEEIGEIEKDITSYLNNFKIWAANQVVVVQAMQNAMVDEVSKQLNASLINAQIGLGFWENFFNDSVARYKAQASYQLGAYQAGLFQANQCLGTPKLDTIKNNPPTADVGSTFGFSTGWLNLNPSQGFVAYEPSRKHFVQEVAEMPASFPTTDPKTGQQTVIPLFWFLQNVSKDITQSPTSQIVFEIRLKPIYLINQFYVGIGIGGIPLDMNALLTSQQSAIDRYHLAKMIVIKKEASDAPVSVGVYEHETQLSNATNSWLSNTSAPSFNPGAWYHIRGTLNGANLQMQVWQEGSPTPAASTVSVTPLPTTTTSLDGQTQIPVTGVPLSVIFSGASMEFDIITPSQKGLINIVCDTHNNCLYPSSTNANYKGFGPLQTEAQRETAEEALYQKISIPTFGIFTDLNANYAAPASQFELIKGHYIYSTAKTGMPQDYVAFATYSGHLPVDKIGGSMADPTPPNAVISLVTGNVFDSTGKVLGQQSGAWGAYQAQNTKVNSLISSQVAAAISTAQQNYIKSSLTPYKFGSITLQPASTEDFANGYYVYTATLPGQTVADYFVLAAVPSNPVTMPFNLLPTKIDTKNYEVGMVSLSTIALYKASSCTATSCKPVTCLASGPYKPFIQQLSPSLQKQIAADKVPSCLTQTQQSQTQSVTPETTITNPSTVTTTQGQQTTNETIPQIGNGSSSLADQQQSAAQGNNW